MPQDCRYAETIGALKRDVINLVRWQKSQNGRLASIESKLYALIFLVVTTLVGVVADIIVK